MAVIETAPLERALPRLKLPWPVLARGAVLGVALALVLEGVNVIGWRNVHVVVPGTLYRCAQQSPQQLESLLARHGIRTVVNLRGTCENAPWFFAQARLTQRLGVSQEDLSFSAGRLPPVREVRQLVAVLDRSERPLLLHCNRGIDRTGFAIAVALLLHTDISVADARGHLGLRHGHLSVGKTGNMDRFLDLYENWLSAAGQKHSRETFRVFAEREYCPGPCRAEFTVLSPETLRRVSTSVPTGLPVRCTNRSVETWQLTPALNAGIHFDFRIFDEQQRLVWGDHAGLQYATVPPGESIDVTLALPPLPSGRYRLWIDLIEGQHGYSYQVGSDPFTCLLEVP